MVTKTKKIAESLTGVMESPFMQRIVDREQPVEPIIDEILKLWRFDLYSRKPGPAYNEDGTFVGTDLDLACFMSALVERKAVINLPTYEARRGKSKTKGQRVVSANNRHGSIMGLSANKEALSFSVRVKDANVITQDAETGVEEVGAPRNFMLVDVTGEWHKGWRRIEFSPTAKENDFLNDRKLWSGHTIVFSNFVHPNRWSSFYGQNYFVTKALIDRLDDQAKFLFEEMKRLVTAKVLQDAKAEGPRGKKPAEDSDTKPIKVDAFEAEVHFGEFKGAYQPAASWEQANTLRNKLIFSVIPELRFYVRTVELAFFKHGAKCYPSMSMPERMPGWLKNAEWRDFVFPGKRTTWRRLVLTQKEVGKLGLSICYRIYEKTERVAK